MTINEGKFDRIIRIVVGLALVYVSWSAWLPESNFPSTAGAVGFVALIIGIIALVTGATGYCPLYRVFGVATNKRIHA